jgi:hypothetical protein
VRIRTFSTTAGGGVGANVDNLEGLVLYAAAMAVFRSAAAVI